MKLVDYLKIFVRLAVYKATQSKHDLSFLPEGFNPEKFITAGKAAALIDDGATVFSAGIAAHARCSIFYWAIKDRFQKTGHPKGLTWITTAAHGGRGKAPGTIEEIALPGLMKEYICSHVESAKAQLRLANEGRLTIQSIPYGEIVFLLEQQAKGKGFFVSRTGKGTFLDPEVGGSSLITGHSDELLISANGDALQYRLPLVDTALLVAPWSDKEGNIYFKDAACINDHYESAMAAFYNGGRVIVSVSGIIEKDETRIRIPAKYVHGIIVNSLNEQTGAIRQKRSLKVLTEGAEENIADSFRILSLINRLSGAAHKRKTPDRVISRVAAALFKVVTPKGALVNFGVGLPEAVSGVLHEVGIHKDYLFSTEAGAYGGVPAPGIFFGAALNPEKLKSSAWMFRHYEENLSVAVFGFLQVDSEGNVNVSRRGERVTDYVGPGGLMNIADCAGTIIFVGHWMKGAEYRTARSGLKLSKAGRSKFVHKVGEVTFSGREALKAGKKVWYVTTVGLFHLSDNGLELKAIMPGIDIQKDIIEQTDAKIIIDEEKEGLSFGTSVIKGKDYFRHLVDITDRVVRKKSKKEEAA